MQDNCPDKFKKLIPLSKVVSACILDLHEDAGKMQQMVFYWAARELRLMQSQTIKSGKRRALITVNQNTRTASLPPDFDEETFVGYIKNGKKYPIPLKTNLVNDNSITTIECEDACEKCGQDKMICNDMTVTESVTLVEVNGNSYEKTVIKKLYPDGGYFLESTIPYWDVTNEIVAYATTKEFIAAIDLKDCGCINPTVENIATIQECCYDCYACHFAPCAACDTDSGGYAIFEDTGLIQFDYKFKYPQVYLEYRGFIPKLNGQLAVPAVAFEALVEATKFRVVEGKKSSVMSNNDKLFRLAMKDKARKNMIKVMARLSLDDIIHIISLTPKFDWTAPSWNDFCSVPATQEVTTITNATVTGCDATPVCPTTSTPTRTPFRLAIKVPSDIVSGLPIAGQATFQNDFLIGAFGVDFIIVNDANETAISGKFTFDSATGTIDRSPNIWFVDDVLIVDFFKNV